MPLYNEKPQNAPVGRGQLEECFYDPLEHSRIAQTLLGIVSQGAQLGKSFICLIHSTNQAAELYLVGVEPCVIAAYGPAAALIIIVDLPAYLHIMECPGGGIVDVP